MKKLLLITIVTLTTNCFAYIDVYEQYQQSQRHREQMELQKEQLEQQKNKAREEWANNLAEERGLS